MGKAMLRFLSVALLMIVASSVFAIESPPYLKLETAIKLEQVSQFGTIQVRLFFKTYGNAEHSVLWESGLNGKERAITYAGRPLRPTAGPSRVTGDGSVVPIAMVLALDVSSSMGGPNYDYRMSQVREALIHFLDNVAGNENLWISLLPFGHDVPQNIWPLETLPTWSSTFLPLTNANAEVLKKAISEIARYSQYSDESIETSLNAAYCIAQSRLLEHLPPSLMNQGAKTVLVVLTDGVNSPGEKAPPEFQPALLPFESVVQRLSRGDAAPTYTIGFALGAHANMEMVKLASEVPNAHFIAVMQGHAASISLSETYADIFTVEGSSWYLDFDTGLTNAELVSDPLSQIAIDNVSIVPPSSMIFLPSVLADWNPRSLTMLAITFVVLAVLFVAWLLFRPKAPVTISTISAPGEPSEDEDYLEGGKYMVLKEETLDD